MSTKEMTHRIIEMLTDEELQGFIVLFKRLLQPKDDMEERKKAFERLEMSFRYIPDLDDEKELAKYKEKILTMKF